MRVLFVCAGLCLAMPAYAEEPADAASGMIEDLEEDLERLTRTYVAAMPKHAGDASPEWDAGTDSGDSEAAPAETPNAPAEGTAETEAEVVEAAPVTPREAVGVCTTCHGLDGIAKIPIAPHLAGESRVYLETQLKAFRNGKREHEMMTVIAEGMSDEDIKAAAKWYSAIRITAEMPE